MTLCRTAWMSSYLCWYHQAQNILSNFATDAPFRISSVFIRFIALSLLVKVCTLALLTLSYTAHFNLAFRDYYLVLNMYFLFLLIVLRCSFIKENMCFIISKKAKIHPWLLFWLSSSDTAAGHSSTTANTCVGVCRNIFYGFHSTVCQYLDSKIG